MFEKIKLGVPFTPALIKNKNEYVATSIVISWGGGMGGCNQTIYTKKKIDIKDLSEPFIKINNIYGFETLLSTNHIVKIGTVKIVELDIYNCGNPHITKPKSTYKYIYVFSTSDVIEYINEYTDIKYESKYEISK